MTTKIVKISELDRNYQTRFTLNEEVVKEYAEAMENGEIFPPVSVVGNRLTDGYHRVAAAEMLGKKEIEAEIVEGDEKAALRSALSANLKHGLRRTNEDKRQALMLAWENRDKLFDEFLGQDEKGKPNGLPSKRQLAAICGVSNFLALNFIEEQRVVENTTPVPRDECAAVENTALQLQTSTSTKTDRFGVAIPERILPAFTSKALKREIKAIALGRKAMDKLRLEDPSCAAIDAQTMIRYDNLIRQMHMSEVFCVCRACGGIGCYRCSQRGFQTRVQYAMNPPELKAEKNSK